MMKAKGVAFLVGILLLCSILMLIDTNTLVADGPEASWKTVVTVVPQSTGTHASSIACLPNGSLAIVYKTGVQGDFGASNIKITKSHDGGLTWSTPTTLIDSLSYICSGSTSVTFLDPALHVDGDRTYFVFCAKPPSASDYSDPSWLYLWWSDDNATTWSGTGGSPDYVNFTSIYPSWNEPYDCGLANPTAFQTLNGSWVIPAWFSTGAGFDSVYSDCFISYPGEDMTSISGWHLLSDETGGESIGYDDSHHVLEPAIAYLSNHSWLCHYRASSNSGNSPEVCLGLNNGSSWSGYSDFTYGDREDSRTDLMVFSSNVTYGLMDGSHEIYHDKQRMLFSWVNSSSRNSMDVALSYDDGATWPITKNLDSGCGAYSDMTVTNNGTIVVEYSNSANENENNRIKVALFNLEWLTDGNDYLDEIIDVTNFVSINGKDNNSIVQDNHRFFNWSKIDEATGYSIRIDDSISMDSPWFQLDNITVSDGNCTNSFLNTSASASPYDYNYWENETTCFFYLPYVYNCTEYGYDYYQVRYYS